MLWISYTGRASLIVFMILMISNPVSSEEPTTTADPTRWIGMTAPDFRLRGTDGATHSLSTMVARGPLIVLWFPKAWTGNVERLLKSADMAGRELSAHGIGMVAASCDKPKYLTPYSEELGLRMTILADPTRTTAIQWGAVGTGREIPHRRAYFVGRDGRIASIRTDLDAENTGLKLIAEARNLGWIN